MFLNLYTSQELFHTAAPVLSTHPLMSSLLRSLLLDNSYTACTMGLTVLDRLLPIFAVHACEQLKQLLPRLLAVLARVICWKERPLSNLRGSFTSVIQLDDIPPEVEDDIERELEDDKPLHIRPDLSWEKLESSFDAPVLSPPSPRALFRILYYLFPRTTLRFLKEPAKCLVECGVVTTPYTVSWEEALDEINIRSRSEVRSLIQYD